MTPRHAVVTSKYTHFPPNNTCTLANSCFNVCNYRSHRIQSTPSEVRNDYNVSYSMYSHKNRELTLNMEVLTLTKLILMLWVTGKHYTTAGKVTINTELILYKPKMK